MREGGDLFIELECLVEISCGNGCHHGLGIQLQRTGGVAVGRLLMDAQMLSCFQLLLGKQPLLAVYMGGGTFLYNHTLHSSIIDL